MMMFISDINVGIPHQRCPPWGNGSQEGVALYISTRGTTFYQRSFPGKAAREGQSEVDGQAAGSQEPFLSRRDATGTCLLPGPIRKV